MNFPTIQGIFQISKLKNSQFLSTVYIRGGRKLIKQLKYDYKYQINYKICFYRVRSRMVSKLKIHSQAAGKFV